MLRGEILKSVEEYAYFIDLLPSQLMIMTIKEFYTLYKYRMKRIEFDNKSDDMRTGRICSVLANIYRDKKKRKNPYTELDFVPQKEIKKKKPQSIESMAAILMAVTKAHGGKIVG
jgi:hypothetical protein